MSRAVTEQIVTQSHRLVEFSVSKMAKIHPVYPRFQRIFFFLSIVMVGGEVNSEAISNRKHGLFHIRYFENRPLEPGYSVLHSFIEKSNFPMEKPTRSTKNERLGCKYLLLCVSKLEAFTQLPPAYHENS